MPTAIIQMNKRIHNEKVRKVVKYAILVFTSLMVIGRLISGVHWFTDIIGGVLLSTSLVMFYNSINKSLEQLEGEILVYHLQTVIEKHYPNSFYETNLHHKLIESEITELVVCGMMTHIYIDTTVRAAKDYGYQITLISDGCATKDLEWNGVTLPATLIQNVYMASLNKKFANVILSSEIV